MMSYLWILLLGSLLAAGAKAQEEDGPETSDDTALSLEDAEAETEAVNTDTEGPQPDDELDPAADDPEDPEAEEAEAVSPTASDPEVAPPAEEGSEDTITDGADAADAAVAPVEGEEETTTTIADLPEDLSEEISTTAEPLETTPYIEVEDLPIEASGDTPTPTPEEQIVTTTTAVPPEQEVSTITLAPSTFPVYPVGEAEQTTTPPTPPPPPPTTTTPPPTTTAEVKEILLVTKAPADPEEVTPGADDSGAVETTAGPFIDEFADQVEKKDSKKIFVASPQDAAPQDAASHETPKADETSSKPLAAVLSGIVVSAVGAVVAYFTYQKKKLCFKNRQADPETGNNVEKADPAEAKSNPEALHPLVDQKS